MRDRLARARRSRPSCAASAAGRIEVVEGGRRRGFGPADAELRATVTIHDPAAWRSLLQRQRRPRRGLRRRALGDRRPGRADADRRPRAAPASTACAALIARPRGLLHRLRRLVPDNTRERRPPPHLRPLRPRQRPLRRLPRRADDVLLRLLPATRAPSLEEAQLAKLERICEQLRLGPENHLLEIGSGWGGLAIHAAREHGCRVTTTTISARAARARRAPGRARPGSRTGSRSSSRTTATSRAATTASSRSR